MNSSLDWWIQCHWALFQRKQNTKIIIWHWAKLTHYSNVITINYLQWYIQRKSPCGLMTSAHATQHIARANARILSQMNHNTCQNALGPMCWKFSRVFRVWFLDFQLKITSIKYRVDDFSSFSNGFILK